jgi:hypothetical protein
MSSATLYRLSGIVLLVGGLLSLVSSAANDIQFPGHNPTSQQVLSPPWILEASLLLVGVLLISIGFPGFYLRQAESAGKLGFAGFVMLWIAMLLAGVSFIALQIAVFPWLAQEDSKLLTGGPPIVAALLFLLVPELLFTVGSILLGISTLRAKVFDRGPGVALLALGIVNILSIPVPHGSAIGNIVATLGDIILALAFAWGGFALVAHKPATVAAPSMTVPSAQTSR